MARGETLDDLVRDYDALVKAGRGSLRAAYRFGNTVEGLHGSYTYDFLAGALSLSTTTLWKYARLAKLYPTEKSLLDTAAQMHTYDIGKLISSDAGIPLRYVLHCRNCGGTDVYRTVERKDEVPDTPAELLRQS